MSESEQKLQNESENQNHEHEDEHEHRHHRKKSKIKPFVYSVMSFFLSVVLFLLSGCLVIQFTVLSKDYMLNTMDSKGYYSMVRYELQSRLSDLCNASGLPKEFAVSFANSYDVKKAVENYIESFYSSDTTIVETTSFKQQLHAAVKTYAENNNIPITDDIEDNILYFINEASSIYTDQISITFFSTIGKYIDNAQTVVSIAIGVLAVLALFITGVIFFTNHFKHRRYRYLCYGLLGGALTTAVLPTIVLFSNIIPKVNLATRSLYNLFVGYFTTFFSSFYICVAVMLALSLLTFLLYIKYYNKYRNN